MGKDFPEFKYYPSAEEVDDWVASVWELVEETDCAGEVLNEQGFSHNLGIRHFDGFQYVRFTPEGMDPFYGYWQPALSGPAPLLIHVPGYGAEMSVHPDLVAAGFNVLHVCPLGYSTPEGADESKKRDGAWPVLPDTILSGGEKGYKFWLANVALAARWAMEREEVIPDRVSFLGSSQGGGCALLLASVFRDRGVRCVGADVPYLTNFPLAAGRGAYGLAARTLQGMSDPKAGWRAMGLIDTLSHAHRLTCPVLLVAGGTDGSCPAETIESLFARLPGTRSYTLLEGVGHRQTPAFVRLGAAWFRLYA